QQYREDTAGGATITVAVQDIPDSVVDPWNDPIPDTLDLLRFALAQQKDSPARDHIALASHPFLRVCDACGSRYADTADTAERNAPQASQRRYCAVCMGKRGEDGDIKDGIDVLIDRRLGHSKRERKPLPYAWEAILRRLPPAAYTIPEGTERPSDFDQLRGSA